MNISNLLVYKQCNFNIYKDAYVDVNAGLFSNPSKCFFYIQLKLQLMDRKTFLHRGACELEVQLYSYFSLFDITNKGL